MQRTENKMIVISCDFTGHDWDEHMAMIEGHRGSVLSLEALSRAVDEAGEAEANFECVMCKRAFEAGEKSWRHPDPPFPETANPHAVICWDCIRQADRTFAKDPDTDWTRKIPPDSRWR